MFSRPIRTLLAAAASLGLVATLAVAPAAAQDCTAEAAMTEAVSDEVELTLATAYSCTDATDAGTWSITVELTNDSDLDVTIEDVELRHVTPSVHASADVDATAEASGLPLDLAAGASGSFDVEGDYVLAQVGAAALANVHLQVVGTVEDAEFFIGLTVHLRGAGTDLEAATEADADADAEAIADVALERRAQGRPDWAPGVPSWLGAMLAEIFPDGFPWGSDAFPPAGAPEGGAEAEAEAAGEEAAAGAGASVEAEVELPDEAVEALPDWVTPGAPPEWVPGPPPFGAP